MAPLSSNIVLTFFMVWFCDLVLFSNSEPFVLFFIAIFLFFSSITAYYQHFNMIEMRVNSNIREVYFLLEALSCKFSSIKKIIINSNFLVLSSAISKSGSNNPSINATFLYNEYARSQITNSFVQFNAIVFSSLMKQFQSVLKLELGTHYSAAFNYLNSQNLDLSDFSDFSPILVIRPFNFSTFDKFFVCAYLFDSVCFADLVSSSPDGFYDSRLLELLVFNAIAHEDAQ